MPIADQLNAWAVQGCSGTRTVGGKNPDQKGQLQRLITYTNTTVGTIKLHVHYPSTLSGPILGGIWIEGVEGESANLDMGGLSQAATDAIWKNLKNIDTPKTNASKPMTESAPPWKSKMVPLGPPGQKPPATNPWIKK